MNILLIDDDIFFASTIKNGLEIMKHNCTSVSSYAEALRRNDYENFDVVLLDLMMPSAEAARQNLEAGDLIFRFLKKRAPYLPVIVITGKDADDISEDTLLGANQIIEKPLDSNLSELIEALDEI